MRRFLLAALCVVAIPAMLFGCGDDDPAKPNIFVHVTPASDTVYVGAVSRFTAVVLGTLRESQLDPALRRDPRRLKEVAAVLDDQPWLDPALLRLARWMEGYYGASLGETLRAMIPVKPLKRPRTAAPAPPPPQRRPSSALPRRMGSLSARPWWECPGRSRWR